MNKLDTLKTTLVSKMGYSNFGSTSEYYKKNPKADVIWNAYILTMDDYSLLQRLNVNFDIDRSNIEMVNNLKEACLVLKQDFFLYSESTVNNVTFNGGIFPYDQWDMRI